MSSSLRMTQAGAKRLDPLFYMPRHRHLEGYAAVVLAGAYEEAGDQGRWRALPGDVLVHSAFDAHQNQIAGEGCTRLNLPLPPDCSLAGAFRIRDPDELVRTAERDMCAAAACLVEQRMDSVASVDDWPDLLAYQLQHGDHLSISDWAERNGLMACEVSRGFKLAYGISPKRFRLEAKVKEALLMIRATSDSLASVAYACGFADQPHLTRAVTTMSGRTPAQWRQETRWIGGNGAPELSGPGRSAKV